MAIQDQEAVLEPPTGLCTLCASSSVCLASLQELMEAKGDSPSPMSRRQNRGQDGLGPIHTLCRNQHISLGALALLLDRLASESTLPLGAESRTALHYLCANESVTIELLAMLLGPFEVGDAVGARDVYGLSAMDILRRSVLAESSSDLVASFALMIELLKSKSELFAICANETRELDNYEAMKEIIDRCPEACQERDIELNFPLHVLCTSRHVTTKSLALLMDTFPDATEAHNTKGQYPINLLCENSRVARSGLIACYLKHAPEPDSSRASTSPTEVQLELLWRRDFLDRKGRSVLSSSPSTMPSTGEVGSPKRDQSHSQPWRYDVVFRDQSLGIEIHHDGLLPNVSSNHSGQVLPRVNDLLEFVNGVRLNPETMDDTCSQAVEIICQSSRPITLGFLSTSGNIYSTPTEKKKGKKKEAKMKERKTRKETPLSPVAAAAAARPSPAPAPASDTSGSSGSRWSQSQSSRLSASSNTQKNGIRHRTLARILSNLNTIATLSTGDKLTSEEDGHDHARLQIDRAGPLQGLARTLRNKSNGGRDQRRKNILSITTTVDLAIETLDLCGSDGSLVAQLADAIRGARAGLNNLRLTYYSHSKTAQDIGDLVQRIQRCLETTKAKSTYGLRSSKTMVRKA